MMKYFLYMILFSAIILMSCEKSSVNNNSKLIEDLIVKNNEITGWTFAGSGWVANNISELTVYIDGEAELYQRYGFIEVCQQSYQGSLNNEQATIVLYVYNLTKMENCIGVYNDNNYGITNGIDWLSGAGNVAKYARESLSSRLQFYRNNYFVKIDINNGSEEALNIIKQFALNIDAKIKK